MLRTAQRNRARLSQSGALLLACLVGLALGLPGCADPMSKTSDAAAKFATTGYGQERHNPAPPYDGPPRTGEQVYAYRCASCHDRTTQGAPALDDHYQWRILSRKGVDVLTDHVISGYARGLLPERGGCRNCSDAELRAAVLYILEESGVHSKPTRGAPFGT